MVEEVYPEVIFRKAAPLDAPSLSVMPRPRYEGLRPGVSILKKGTVLLEKGLPLPCDILWERDVEVPLRDGTVIYVDIFRPTGQSEKIPAILSWSPYGKHGPQGPPLGVPPERVSGLQKFEGPDPAYWCNHGYAIVNADTRGAFSSGGDIYFWGTVDARDGRDAIEWIATRPWCNGKVGMSGNSWLAIAQWFIAAENPPHLAAIAPWEGLSDLYRQDVVRGGIPNTGFNNVVISSLKGKSRVEDISAMVQRYPLMNPYWEDKSAKLERIRVPAYVVASWTNDLHTLGSLEGFRRIPSQNKWLRVHNTHEWADYYTPENVEDLQRFFDRYLKGIGNGWEKTPRVRLSVLDLGGTDLVSRAEEQWPLARTKHRRLYLDASTGTLSPDEIPVESSARYRADDGKGQATFLMKFKEDTELTGYFKLRLWVEAQGAEDMDLFVQVQKLDPHGNPLASSTGIGNYTGPNGRLRVSHRQTDHERSTPWLPCHIHRVEETLRPGEPVPCDILIWPSGMLFHEGEQLRLFVAGFNPIPFHIPGIPGPTIRNRGHHIIHTGGKYDSYLLLPVVQP